MLAQAAEKIKEVNQTLVRSLRVGGRSGDRRQEGGGQRFQAAFTRSRRDIIAAQRMRYRIFSEEYGARMVAPFGLDRDRYDRHCLHLVVRDRHKGNLIVGYTRVLTDDAAARIGGFYSRDEFDLDMLSGLNGRVAELGRTCILPAYRNGAVITTLWSRLAGFMMEEDIRYLIGCASVSLDEDYDLGHIRARIRGRHLAGPSQRVIPRLPADAAIPDDPEGRVAMPPLLKAYLRMGARVCGEPCLDPDFNCLDFFILLGLEALPNRYVQHFLQPAALGQAV